MILECLVAAMFFEARDQPIDGQVAVAEVILNRVEHEDFPDDVCSVVYEPMQFSFTHDGLSDDPSTHTLSIDVDALEAIEALAEDILSEDIVLGLTSTHYHTNEVNPFWSTIYEMDGGIGDHVFYTCDTNKRNC